MANQQKRGEGGGKCSLMAKWWAGVPKEQRPFIEERAKAFPFMRPCPKTKGWWVRKEDECDSCEYAVFEAGSSSETSTMDSKTSTLEEWRNSNAAL